MLHHVNLVKNYLINFNTKFFKKRRYLYYSSNKSIKICNILPNNEMLLDINNERAKCKFIISTSSITVGNSYEREDIEDVYIFGGISYFGGCSVRDFLLKSTKILLKITKLNIMKHIKKINTIILNQRFIQKKYIF